MSDDNRGLASTNDETKRVHMKVEKHLIVAQR